MRMQMQLERAGSIGAREHQRAGCNQVPPRLMVSQPGAQSESESESQKGKITSAPSSGRHVSSSDDKVTRSSSSLRDFSGTGKSSPAVQNSLSCSDCLDTAPGPPSAPPSGPPSAPPSAPPSDPPSGLPSDPPSGSPSDPPSGVAPQAMCRPRRPGWPGSPGWESSGKVVRCLGHNEE